MIWLIAREFWKRYKPGTVTAMLGLALLTALHLSGWIWVFEEWCRTQLHVGPTNPIVLFATLLALGQVIGRKP